MINILLSLEDLPSALAPDRDFSWLARAAEECLDQAASGAQPGLSLVIADDAHLHELNRQFLGIDAPTDVLAFPVDEADPETGERYLGDVVISYPRAEAQARAGGHSLQAEMQLLAVHGVLHLLGYDHGDEAEKTSMWRMQASILQAIGCGITGPVSNADGEAARHQP